MRLDIENLPLRDLLLPISRAGEAIARLDERIAHSPVGAGWVERAHFSDAVASLYLDGELVHREDLVLHDVHMDVRSPTHELVIAHAVLRTRRQIQASPADWALSQRGLAMLRGRADAEIAAPERKEAPPALRPMLPRDDADDALADELSDGSEGEFAEIDTILARSQAALDGAMLPPRPERDPSIYDEEWDEEARFLEWQALMRDTRPLPAVLRAALLLDAWTTIDVLQHSAWIGRLLVAAVLREAGTTSAHLLAINSGLNEVRWERRRARDRRTRLLAFLEAFEQAARLGLKEHERLAVARQQLERKLVGRRSNSKLPQLVALVLSRPLVSAGMIARELEVTQQGAVLLAEELGLREMTGRGRYRAWGVL